MAKKALVQKQQAKPKFKVRGYSAAVVAVAARSVYRDFGLCRLCLRQMAHAGEVPGMTKARGEGGGGALTMTDPIADMLTRIRNANVAFHDDVPMPSSKLKEAVAQILEREGYITGFEVDDRPGRPGRRLTITHEVLE